MSRLFVTHWGPVLLAAAALNTQAQGIYTCVDAQGRRITADRPIAECMDREQKELTTRGTVKRVVPPAYTAQERATQQAAEQADAERRARASEAQRKERAMVQRYPNQAAHDKERADALAQVDQRTQGMRQHLAALERDRKRLDEEMEFYRKDPSQAPARLQHRIKDTDQQLRTQQAALEAQEQEKARVNARFDEELLRLKALWAGQPNTSR